MTFKGVDRQGTGIKCEGFVVLARGGTMSKKNKEME